VSCKKFIIIIIITYYIIVFKYSPIIHIKHKKTNKSNVVWKNNNCI